MIRSGNEIPLLFSSPPSYHSLGGFSDVLQLCGVAVLRFERQHLNTAAQQYFIY
jgi:hypothetical protein